MADELQEPSSQFETSPFWKERERLTPSEKKALKGIHSLERLVQKLAKNQNTSFNFGLLATDLYEEAFKPFGFSIRSYRRDNTVVTQGELEYPHYDLIPKLMNNLGEEVGLAFAEAAKGPVNVAKIIFVARKVHDMVYIHPFSDGNGRVARGLVHFVLRRFGYYLPNWRFGSRDSYINTVAAGKDNPEVFDLFLAQALISSYKEKEAKLAKAPYSKLTRKARQVKIIREKLENFVSSLKQTGEHA